MSDQYTANIGPVSIPFPEMDRKDVDRWVEAIEQWILGGYSPGDIGPPQNFDRDYDDMQNELTDTELRVDDADERIECLEHLLEQRRDLIRKLIAKLKPRPAF